MSRRKISCFVITHNEADRIEACLKSVAGWVDELIVLDSGSTDGTRELALKYTPNVVETDWPGFGPQRNRALSMCTHDWVLSLDADEVVTPALRDEVDQVLAEPDLNATFIKFPWHTYLFGKPLKHGRYSTPQGKLFFKQGAQFKDRSVHETLLLPEYHIRVLKAPLLHYSWRDYQHVMEKHLKYGVLGAGEKAKKGKRTSIPYAVLRAFTDFIQQYFIRLGFLDGQRGLLMAMILSQYAFHKYAALWTLNVENQENKTK
ncbi:glycosyltransferase family 2 protein [Aestuariibacter sp. AA17]|uniref:Glycosyltransferase family 2 protein n=1 Tax=Fluctibacter corallii TaxID=2984329 RepID=A0ABT3ABV8_9ALTE|nr:glycosyltransferase family 2 protein [Aestuariibacter sp. AA17]MCV2886159.1 glycosyltransferase family 2 protein [Aestuariibacter sp. AA17]